MFMPQRVRRWYLDLLRDKVIANGKALRGLRATRSAVSADKWPEDCAYLDTRINTLERRHERLLTKFKETNACIRQTQS